MAVSCTFPTEIVREAVDSKSAVRGSTAALCRFNYSNEAR